MARYLCIDKWNERRSRRSARSVRSAGDQRQSKLGTTGLSDMAADNIVHHFLGVGCLKGISEGK